ncbi:MAG: urease accessory protein UreD [Pseudomonadales bacterium]|jgi:urease accessory protein|nr:urease accessory protein UreD [Pseudomonadales bacterium]
MPFDAVGFQVMKVDVNTGAGIEKASSGAQQGWRASLSLDYSQLGARTLLAHQHTGPLRVQRPFFPEGGVNHTYVLHPPGGMVGDDVLDIAASVGASAHTLITTPGATKAYRNVCTQSRLTTTLQVDGTLEWLPQEVILFDKSKLASQTRISLGRQARLISWEIVCLGRPAGELPFNEGYGRFLTTVQGSKGLLLHDNLMLDAKSLFMSSPWGLNQNTAIGVMLAYPGSTELRDKVRHVLRTASFPVGVTLLDDLLVIRGMAAQAQDLRRIFILTWELIRPLILAREACPPRIWNT